MIQRGDRLTARAPSSRSLILGGRLLASALKGRLLAAGALGFLGADAATVATAAGDGNSASSGRHCDVRCCWLLVGDWVAGVGVVDVDGRLIRWTMNCLWCGEVESKSGQEQQRTFMVPSDLILIYQSWSHSKLRDKATLVTGWRASHFST